MPLRLTTVQASAFKSTFETLKDILNDVNIMFRPSGMFITCLDTARTSLIDLQLHAANFEEYVCDEEEIIAGVNIANCFKLLKTISSNDVLKLAISSKEFLNITIESQDKKSKTDFALKLLDINESRITLPSITMNIITTLPSADFQRLLRDMNHVSSGEIVIIREKNRIRFQCEGDFASQDTEIETVETIDEKLSGLFSLKYLNIFAKSASMCSSMQLMQETENRFLKIVYNVACLGSLSFYLASKIEGDQ
ncbi:hypothetical protein DSLPV1_096 [Dishui lake phycodnavirus 1]|uniref:hypothetical protein n=1 Tax=Dishui lake phycodnavirus 1 TaxID=2079134 RepID=UPI000CD6C658|nr:hypothetical protein C5Y57_gp096 [Dishui lake phycodnavirus 1]AUT19067.1 hypothetical protein DSLPV1_096 [Dishui lake phycodnavirus 1]